MSIIGPKIFQVQDRFVFHSDLFGYTDHSVGGLYGDYHSGIFKAPASKLGLPADPNFKLEKYLVEFYIKSARTGNVLLFELKNTYRTYPTDPKGYSYKAVTRDTTLQEIYASILDDRK